MKKYGSSIAIYIIIVIFIIFLVLASNISEPVVEKEPYTYSQLLTQIKNQEVKKVEITSDADIVGVGRATVILAPDPQELPIEQPVSDNPLDRLLGRNQASQASKNTDRKETVDIPNVQTFMEFVQNQSLDSEELVVITSPAPRTSWFISFIPPIIVMVISVFLLIFILQQMQGGAGGNRVMSFGKSKAKMFVDDKKKITFEQVAGLEEEKAELQEMVEFLKQPKKFIDIGARIPKGVLLVGPPGTGKTYLAKACSGEAGVPFFSISGSDFVEMFVGVGASRVRDLFEQAKKHPSCIVFIDEIDAVGRRRGAGLGGGHDEREQTLNQLLVEMDGFGVNEGVIIIAATNRPDILDPALLRPGRFDRSVVVGKPDVKGREAVLKIHSKGKQIGKDVNFQVVAQTTPGFTPADLENLLNEAALIAARTNKKEIEMEDMRKAFVKVGIGTEKTSRVISEKERKITAYHEAGHAIIFEIMPELDPTYMISVIPTGMAGGYTMPLPGEDKGYITKGFMEQTIVSLLGGRAAEELVLKDITTGASNDIHRATGIARDMITKYGMSKRLGPIQFGDDNDEIFIGRDLAHARNYGENVASAIDAEIKRVIEDAYEEALRIITEHIDVLHKIAKALMEREKITGDEVRLMFPEGTLKETVKKGFMESMPDEIDKATTDEVKPEEPEASEQEEKE